jgi:hypothetical protein
MKIFEVVEPNFDLVDDTSFYMRNDPMFYRKQYFPAMASMADMHSKGKKIDRTTLEKMVVHTVENIILLNIQMKYLQKTNEMLS